MHGWGVVVEAGDPFVLGRHAARHKINAMLSPCMHIWEGVWANMHELKRFLTFSWRISVTTRLLRSLSHVNSFAEDHRADYSRLSSNGPHRINPFFRVWFWSLFLCSPLSHCRCKTHLINSRNGVIRNQLENTAPQLFKKKLLHWWVYLRLFRLWIMRLWF